MKALFKLISLSLTATLMSCTSMAKTDRKVATEGGNSSGGGTSIVCRNDAGAVESAKLYDLFEAENDPIKPIEIFRNDNLTPMERIKFSFVENSKLYSSTGYEAEHHRPEIPPSLEKALNLVKRDWASLKPGTRLPLVTDVKPIFLSSGKNCGLETTAYYDDDNYKLYVDMEIYNKLSNTDKAGLLLHEAIYKNHRIIIQDRTSTWVRKIVAGLLSKEFLVNKYSNDIDPHIMDISRILSINTERPIAQSPQYEEGITESHKILDLFLGTKKLVCTLDSDKSKKIEVGMYEVNKDTSRRSWHPYMHEPELKAPGSTQWVFDYALRHGHQVNNSSFSFAIYGLTNADPDEKDPEFSGAGYAPVLKLNGEYHFDDLYAGRENITGVYQIVTYKSDTYDVKKIAVSEKVTCSMN